MPGPRDVPNPADIITEPRKRKVPAHLNANNAITNPIPKHQSGPTAQAAPISQPSTSRARSPTIEIEEDKDDRPKSNTAPRSLNNILESTNDEQDARDEERSHCARPQQKLRGKQSCVILGSDEEENESEPVAPPPKKQKGRDGAQLHEEGTVPEEPEEDAKAMLA
ncbi:hypothetical protein H1R20_g16277, partial [Candolleomyces eurysporus]